MTSSDERLVEARALTRLGWPLLPVRGKVPLTAHGVKDATTDMATIAAWLHWWRDAGLAVACGAPGPEVLDIDRQELVPAGVWRLIVDRPRVATPRPGLHVYGAGQDRGTIRLEYGELRGRGSYVVCPPSAGYEWVQQLNKPFEPFPPLITGGAQTAGRGAHTPPAGLVPYGERWPYLRDFAVRLARTGVTDERRIFAHLWCEFELACEPHPPPRPGELESLARWAAHSDIAARERSLDELSARIRTCRQERSAG
jgi:hypothetical protein